MQGATNGLMLTQTVNETAIYKYTQPTNRQSNNSTVFPIQGMRFC